MTERPIVYLVDDDAAVRDALGSLLRRHGMEVVACDGAPAFLDAVDRDRPGCAVVDIRMPGMDGMELQAEIARRVLPIPILFLTGHGDIPMTVRAMKDGALDFLTKPVRGEDLLRCVRHALAESEVRFRRSAASQAVESGLSSLTVRERDVVQLAAAGLANKIIANRLGISHRTVEIHKARAFAKLGVRSAVELARLVEIPPDSGAA